MFGSHPYSSSSTGTEQSIKSITIDDLKKFHSEFYVAKNSTIVLVGNLKLNQATKIAEKISSGLTVGVKATALAAITCSNGPP